MIELLPTLILAGIAIYLTYRVYILTKALQYTLSSQAHAMLAMQSLQMQVALHQQIFDELIEEADSDDILNEQAEPGAVH